MKKVLKNRLSAMEAVFGFCQQYPAVWSMLLAFANAVTAIGIKIQSIISVQSLQQANNTGVAITKFQLKEAMVNVAAIVAAAMQGYAQNINDMTLYNRLIFSPADALKGKDTDALSKCREIYDIVFAIAVGIRTPYGITDPVLTMLKDATDDFEGVESSTRNVISNKTAYTEQLTTLVDEGNAIMRKQILKIGRQFKPSNPQFYTGLRSSARLITQTTHTKLRVESFNDLTDEALAGVTVSVAGTGQQAVTNSKGKCLIYLPSGTYTVTFSKENYISLTREVKIIRGSNTVRIEMSPAFDIPPVTVEKKENVQ